MPAMGILALQAAADARMISALERIATAQVIIAVVMGLIGLLVLASAVLVMLEFRAVNRLLRKATASADDLKPHLIPLIDRAKTVADDVHGMADNVRRRVDDSLHTLEELRRSVERAGSAAEERVRRFAAVLDVVQSEAEELLLDAAATARGLHETARALQDTGPRRTTATNEEEP